MPLRNKDALAFTREVLRPRVTRPQTAIALYPDTQSDTKVEVLVTNTVLALRFGTDVESITYTDLSVPDLVATVNRTAIPVKAVALSRALILGAGDLIGPVSYQKIPQGFNVYDRLSDDGVILRIARYTVKYDRLSNVKLLPPYSGPPGLPWRPLITNGSFTQEFRGRRFHFAIPEVSDQAWSLAYGRPFKDVKGVPVNIKGDNIIQLPRFPVHWTEDNMLFFTENAPLSTSIIEDVDIYNGLVYTKSTFNPTSSLTVDYTYLEENYIYPYLNINAHFSQNPDLIDKFVVFYMVPVESLIASRTNRTVFHIVADSLLGAIDSIESFDVDIPIAIIGAYSIQQIMASDRATILDLRVLGGGLRNLDGARSTVHSLDEVKVDPDARKEVAPRIEDIYKDAARFYDLGKYDGEPYPGAAAVVLDLPTHLRGSLPDAEIREKASKFLAAGVYPVFEFSERTGSYIDGFSQDISMASNLTFSGQYTGSYWSPIEVSIPSGTVMEDWGDVRFEPDLSVTGLDASSVLEVKAGGGFFQSYLKSSPDAILEWEERTLIALSGNNIPINQFTSWEKKRFVDSRDVGDGQLMKGYLVAEAHHETKQFREFTIFSPYRADQTGNLLKDIGKELSTIQHRVTRLSKSNSVEGPRIYVHNVSNVNTLQTHTTSPYVGTNPIHTKVFDLATIAKSSGVYSPYAQQVGTGIVSSFAESAAFAQYDVGTDLYTEADGYGFDMGPQLEILTNYARYLLDTVGSGDSQYRHVLSGYSNALVQLSGANQVPVNEPGNKWYIEPTYTYTTAGGLVSGSIDVYTGFRDVSASGDAHRMTEMLPGLIGIWSAIPFSHSEFFSDDTTISAAGNLMITGVPGFVLDSYSGVVQNYMPEQLTGAARTGDTNSYVADHWYASHNLYGTVAGTIARDGMLIYEALTSGSERMSEARNGEDFTRGAASGDRTYIAGRVEYILDTVITGFAETLLKGGILDEHTPRLLEAFALAAYRGDIEASSSRADFTGRRMAYSGMYATGIDIMLRSMVTPEGDIQERGILYQNIGPFSGTPPADIIGALSAGVLLDDSYLAPLQGAFKTLTGVYGHSGTYPQDANLNSLAGGREAAVFNALATAFIRVQDKYGDPGLISIDRKAKL